MKDFFTYFSVTFLAILSYILWYRKTCGFHLKDSYRLPLYPLFYFRDISFNHPQPGVYAAAVSYTFVINGLICIIFRDSPIVYLIAWGLVLLIETYGAISFLFHKPNWIRQIILFIIVTAYLTTGILISISNWRYDDMNIFDLYCQIVIFSVSLIVIINIALKGTFFQNMEKFFVFFVLCLHSVLQVLLTIPTYIDIFTNFEITLYSLRLFFLLWIISIPCIHYLKSRLLSRSSSSS